MFNNQRPKDEDTTSQTPPPEILNDGKTGINLIFSTEEVTEDDLVDL